MNPPDDGRSLSCPFHFLSLRSSIIILTYQHEIKSINIFDIYLSIRAVSSSYHGFQIMFHNFLHSHCCWLIYNELFRNQLLTNICRWFLLVILVDDVMLPSCCMVSELFSGASRSTSILSLLFCSCCGVLLRCKQADICRVGYVPKLFIFDSVFMRLSSSRSQRENQGLLCVS